MAGDFVPVCRRGSKCGVGISLLAIEKLNDAIDCETICVICASWSSLKLAGVWGTAGAIISGFSADSMALPPSRSFSF